MDPTIDDLASQIEGPKDVSLAPKPAPAAELSAQARPLTGAAEDVNLVSILDEETQRKVVDASIRDFDADVDSRKPRMMRLKEYQGLYASVMKAKSFPFRNSANVNLPILTYPMLQIQGRLFDMIWPSDGKIMYATATNLADLPRANMAEAFGNAYLRHKMPEMAQGIDDTLHQTCCYGSAFRRTYWNSAEGRVASDWIPIEDFVVAHGQRSQDPSMRDVPRYTLVQHLTFYDIESYGDKGVFSNTEKVTLTDPDRKDETEFTKQLEKIDGTSNSTEDTTTEDKTRMVLEQYRMWRLPNRPDENPLFDGKAHPVIVTIDEQSRTLLRFVVREEPDPDDFQRYTKETQMFEAHLSRLESFVNEDQAHQTASEAITAQGLPLPPGMAQAPTPPAPPEGLKVDEQGMPEAPAPQRQRELCFFTHYRAFPSEGFYGLGFGDFLSGLNRAVNTLINQHIDGGTLRNAMPGFISAQLKGQRGTVNVQPGELIEVDAPMGSIKDGMYFPEFPPADPSTMRLVQMLMESADKLVASSDIMTGQTSGANRTAKEVEVLSEQVTMQLTVLARRIKEAFRHELDKIWRIWGVFLTDDEVIEVVGPDEQSQQLRAGKDMFTPGTRIMPAADPRTKTQRLGETMQIFQAIVNNPYLMNQPPPIRDGIMRAVTEDVLRAHGAEKIVRLLPPPPQPPQPPPPPPPMPYWAENAGFLRGQDRQPHPSDDDLQHITGHQQVLQGPAGSVLDKPGRDMLERHIRFHTAANIEKEGQRQQQAQAQFQQLLGAMHQGQGGPAAASPQGIPQ